MPFVKKLLLLAVTLGGIAVTHRWLLHKSLQRFGGHFAKFPQTPLFTSEQLIDIGLAHRTDCRPTRSYLSFSKSKAAGVVRVGLFGDSFVFGEEAAPGHDIGALLQRHLEQRGTKNIEVINFGVATFGESQTFLMWRYLGKDYDLDYVVVFPRDFHDARDTSFAYKPSLHTGLHARFILDDGKLTLLRVPGKTPEAAVRSYFAAWPPWVVWRYDFRLPETLKAWSYSRLGDRRNPFYYVSANETKREVLELYEAILRQYAKEAKRVLVVLSQDDLRPLKSRIHEPNLRLLDADIDRFLSQNLYLAPQGHSSALGNQLRARLVGDWLLGKSGTTFQVIDVKAEPPVTSFSESTQGLHFDRRGLDAFRDVRIEVGSESALRFHLPMEAMPFDFASHHTASVIDDGGAGGKEPRYLGFGRTLRGNETVTSGGVRIGSIEATSPRQGRVRYSAAIPAALTGDILIDGIPITTPLLYLRAAAGTFPDLARVSPREGRFTLALEGQPSLREKMSRRYRVHETEAIQLR